MAENQNPSPSPAAADAPVQGNPADAPRANTKPTKADLRQIYALPAPIRTFPLPAFNPSNPLSLLQLAFTWGKQLLFAAREPSIVHSGVWAPELGAVVIVDQASIRALWEQGFYGKGHLSRSEPNWFRAEQVRLGLVEDHVSEVFTAKRREERRNMKWERAKAELEAIRRTRAEEARRAEEEARSEAAENAEEIGESRNGGEVRSSQVVAKLAPPVGPLELLALPNSPADLEELSKDPKEASAEGRTPDGDCPSAPRDAQPSGSNPGTPISPLANGPGALQKLETASPRTPLKRQKSVRFSPEVRSTTVDLLTPPTPELGALNGKDPNGHSQIAPLETTKTSAVRHTQPSPVAPPLVDKEHLQLTREEAFFLSFALGTLTVTDPSSQTSIPTRSLLGLFRSYSYNPPSTSLSPDDPFLVHYVAYHHFRSLGFAPRPGIKFAVDWLLYLRGPVFDHAEYGVVVVPSYSHQEWKDMGKKGRELSWSWFHGTSRTLSHAVKTILIAYVDVPPPSLFDEALEKGVVNVLRLYSVREVIFKRWSPNRNRKA
ncbi:hypothetical protein VUR80DRAFT_6955 [Thermomyces stellatus]